MANVNALVVKLRELFDIKVNQPGIQGVWSAGGPYNHVILEINDFTFGDHDIKKLFEAKEHAQAVGFYMTPQLESESRARHRFVFYF
jgi:hypothetical protein